MDYKFKIGNVHGAVVYIGKARHAIVAIGKQQMENRSRKDIMRGVLRNAGVPFSRKHNLHMLIQIAAECLANEI